jgi:hypothetical protein
MSRSAQLLSGLLILLPVITLCDGLDSYTYEIDCNNLRMGQYICPHPDYDFIDPKTQQPRGCTKENKAKGGPDGAKISLDIPILISRSLER